MVISKVLLEVNASGPSWNTHCTWRKKTGIASLNLGDIELTAKIPYIYSHILAVFAPSQDDVIITPWKDLLVSDKPKSIQAIIQPIKSSAKWSSLCLCPGPFSSLTLFMHWNCATKPWWKILETMWMIKTWHVTQWLCFCLAWWGWSEKIVQHAKAFKLNVLKLNERRCNGGHFGVSNHLQSYHS